MDPASNPPAGWYPDPDSPGVDRFWNGHNWAEQRRPHQSTVVQNGTNGLATAAMVLGIIGVLFAWIPLLGVFGLMLGLLALVFGFLGHKNARAGAPGKGVATAGIMLGVACIALFGLATVLPFVALNIAGQEVEETFRDIAEQLDP